MASTNDNTYLLPKTGAADVILSGLLDVDFVHKHHRVHLLKRRRTSISSMFELEHQPVKGRGGRSNWFSPLRLDASAASTSILVYHW